MNILFIGSSGPLSILPLKDLLKTGHTVCAVGIELIQTNPFYNHLFPITNASENSHIDIFSKSNNLDVIVFDKALNLYDEIISSYDPDIILVSCFGKKLPENILSIPRLGCFNLHPSLLPQFRGPNPVFWQLRNGARTIGVSLHRMTNYFDDGDILSQSSTTIPDGLKHQEIKLILAELASKLISDTLNNFQQALINARPQDEQTSSYFSYPYTNDYTVSEKWPAQRIFNFIKAYQTGDTVFPCELNGKIYNLKTALAYHATDSCLFELSHNQIFFPCTPGFIHCSI